MPHLGKTIQVTIVDDSALDKCDALCGEDWSSTQVIALASQRLKERFGNQVKLEYLDLAKSTINQHILELKQRIRNEDLTLPLLVIDSEPRISGQFDIRQLLDAIDAEIEIR